jgi:hypothetical protein
MNNDIMSIDVIEIVEPFEIIENNYPIKKNNLLFKEILYVSYFIFYI